MPIILAGVFILSAIGVVFYFPMQKNTVLQAVGSGRELGFDAAYAVAEYGPSIIPRVLGVVESPAPGRDAAAATLALIGRRSGSQDVVSAIKKRLGTQKVGTEYRAAYALALGQIHKESGEAAAAELAVDASEVVRRAAIQALARARTDAGLQALGRALGDSDDVVRHTASDAIADMSARDPEKAAIAVAAAATLEESAAHVATAKLAIPIAQALTPDQILPLLKSELGEARAIALKAMGRSMIAAGGQHAAGSAQVKELLDVHDQPPDVKAAALEVVRDCRLTDAGAEALAVLDKDPDMDLRAKAALAVGRTKPEGAFDSLVRTLLLADATREVKVSCLMALMELQKLDDEKALNLARVLIPILEGEDKVLAGLSILALLSATDMDPDETCYDAAQWKAWVTRRDFEIDTIARIREAFEAIKVKHKEKPDAEKTVKAINAIGDILQKLRDTAHKSNQGDMDTFITEMVNFNREVKKGAR